jgi:hypothetical protein
MSQAAGSIPRRLVGNYGGARAYDGDHDESRHAMARRQAERRKIPDNNSYGDEGVAEHRVRGAGEFECIWILASGIYTKLMAPM